MLFMYLKLTIRNITVAGLVLAASAARTDWPCFQGPWGNSIADAQDLMKAWPSNGPRLVWSLPVGSGFAVPVIQKGKAYLLDRKPGEQDILRCIGLESGKEIWRYAYDAAGNIDYAGSRAQPAVTDDHVFTVGTFGHVHCISKTTRKPVWRRKLTDDFKIGQPGWAFSQSPLLYGDVVIVAPVARDAGVVAYRQSDGEIAWQSERLKGGLGYSSPMLATIQKIDQVVVATTKGLTGVDARDGTILWHYGDWSCRVPISSPLPIGDGRIFISGGYGAGAAMIDIHKRGNSFHAETRFKTDKCQGQIQPPVLYQDHLYLNGNDKDKKIGFVCMDLDGNIKWNTGTSPGFDWGGTLLADDMLYVVDGNAGDLCMILPDPGAYTEAGRAHFLDGDAIWSYILLSDGKLLMRDQSKLVCVDVQNP
jgi:outer membrane protein assembly factor BamB